MLRLVYEDTRYRIIAACCTDKAVLNDCARRWLAAFDAEFGITGFANVRSYKLHLFCIWARIVAATVRPIWWCRGW